MPNEPFDDISPYTQAYTAIWVLFETHGAFDTMVSEGNRKRYDLDDQRRDKPVRSDADLPTVELLPVGGQGNPFRTSTSSWANQIFRVTQIASGDRIKKAGVAEDAPQIGYFQLKWQIFRALAKGGNNLGGLTFVRGFVLDDMVDRLDDSEDQRGSHGWSGDIDIVVDMWFDRTAITT